MHTWICFCGGYSGGNFSLSRACEFAVLVDSKAQDTGVGEGAFNSRMRDTGVDDDASTLECKIWGLMPTFSTQYLCKWISWQKLNWWLGDLVASRYLGTVWWVACG